MSDNHPQPGDSLDLAHAVDALCDRFEAAWQGGERPDLDAWLPREEALRRAALHELARLDLEYRLQKGEAVRVEEYFARYPSLRDDPEAALRLLRAGDRGRRLQEAALRPKRPRS
jgi:hypothetical protein